MLRQNLFMSIIAITGTALAIMMIMTIIVSEEIKNISVDPERHRSRYSFRHTGKNIHTLFHNENIWSGNRTIIHTGSTQQPQLQLQPGHTQQMDPLHHPVLIYTSHSAISTQKLAALPIPPTKISSII